MSNLCNLILSYLIYYKFSTKDTSKILIVCNIKQNTHVTTLYDMIEDFLITTTFNCYQEHTSSPISVYHHHYHHHTQCISLIETTISV